MAQVFISYSRKDLDFVERLASDLQSAGLTVWYDLSELDGGTQWGMEIQSAIEKSQFFLVVLSPNMLTSKWVQREFLFAESCNLKVIPLQYQPCRQPMWLLDLHLIDLQGENYNVNLKRLLKALDIQPPLAEQRPVPLLNEEGQRKQTEENQRITRESEQRAIELKERLAIQEKQKRIKADHLAYKLEEKSRKEEKDRIRRASSWKKLKPRLPLLITLVVVGIMVIIGLYLIIPLIGGGLPSTLPATSTFIYKTQTPFREYFLTPVSGYKWNRPSDSQMMMNVPAGSFTMGGGSQEAMALCKQYNSEGCEMNWFTDADPAHSVTLDEFWIDLTEVTNGMYAKCVAAGNCDVPDDFSSYTRIYYDDVKFKDYPVIYVSWQDAVDYCTWAGARLPTEEQWEMAARGGDAGRLFPWGNEKPTDLQANFGKKIIDTTPVGLFPDGASLYGALDMAGNVYEWVDAWYDPYPGGDPQGNPYFGKSYRVVRGGDYSQDFNLLTFTREFSKPDESSPNIGFRCARSVEP